MKFGLARVSTDKLDAAMQIDALTKYGEDEIVEEKVTGTGAPRFGHSIVLGTDDIEIDSGSYLLKIFGKLYRTLPNKAFIRKEIS